MSSVEEVQPAERTSSASTKAADRALDVARSHRWSASALAWALFASLYYAIDRSRAAIVSGEVDPLAIVSTTRIDYFWRIQLSLFVGSVIAAAVFAFAAGRETKVLRGLTTATIPIGVFCCVLAVVWP